MIPIAVAAITVSANIWGNLFKFIRSMNDKIDNYFNM